MSKLDCYPPPRLSMAAFNLALKNGCLVVVPAFLDFIALRSKENSDF